MMSNQADQKCSSLTISTDRVRKLLTACVVGLTLAGLVFVWIRFSFPDASLKLSRFDLNGEGNIPAWYQAMTLLAAAMLLAVIANAKQRTGDSFRVHWSLLALGFVLLSFDEAAELHERLIDPLNAITDFSGVLHFAWVVPGGFAVLLVLLGFGRFLCALPRRTRRFFLVAAGLYLGGALGLELWEGWVASHRGMANLLFYLLTVVEEAMEMIGIATFLVGLVDYLSQQEPDVTLRFR